MPDLTTTSLATVVRWSARDFPQGTSHEGFYDIITRDVGATIGVGVYDGHKLIHSFYANTRYPGTAEEIARDLIADVVKELADQGARFVALRFPERFPAHVYEAGHNPLDPSHLDG